MERSQRSESSASVATSTLRRGSRGSADQTDDQGSTLDRRRNSFVGRYWCSYIVLANRAFSSSVEKGEDQLKKKKYRKL